MPGPDMPARPLTPATFHILLTLAEEAAHGYHIKRVVEERTDGDVVLGAGTLYAGIRRMQKDGLIEEVEAPAHIAESESALNPRWRFYGITESGTETLNREIRRLERDLAAAHAIKPRPA